MKKCLKLAEIRKNDNSPCPFGLPIPFGCTCAGKNIDRMAPLNIMGDDSSEDEKQMIGNANTKLLAWNLLKSSEKPTQCPYVGHVLEKQESVECNYDDMAPREGSVQALQPSPFYSKMFNGSINGLATVPVGYYTDYNTSRNSYYGTYSLTGCNVYNLISKLGKSKNKL